MKIERVNGLVFKIDTASYNTGDVVLYQDETKGELSLYLKNGSYSLPIFTGKHYTKFTDAAGAVFATFTLCSAYLAAAIAKGDAISALLTDTGSVTQETSITTGVTVNATNGTVTTVASTLAAGAETSFTVTNSKVLTTSRVHVQEVYPIASDGWAEASVSAVANGSFVVKLKNLHASEALNAAVRIDFLVA